jgi:hypothetical protein
VARFRKSRRMGWDGNWRTLEVAAVGHMRLLGFRNARLTRAGADGGIDVVASKAVAQVKAHRQPVGRPDVQRLKGAAHDVRHAVFFSLAGYTPRALDYAETAGVALFVIDRSLTARPVNSHARRLTRRSRRVRRRIVADPPAVPLGVESNEGRQPQAPDETTQKVAQSESATPVTNTSPAMAKEVDGRAWPEIKRGLRMGAPWLLLLMGGPIAYLLSLEALRRSCDRWPTLLAVSDGRRRFAAAVVSVVGALAEGGSAAKDLYRSVNHLGVVKPVPVWATLVGVGVVMVLLGGLTMLARSGRARRLSLPGWFRADPTSGGAALPLT